MNPLRRILAVWRPEIPLFAAGALVSLAATAAAAALALAAGHAAFALSAGTAALAATIAGIPLLWLLRGLGTARIVLRYAERLLTHHATFRALTRLRVWFFHGLARSALGGLGTRRSGDVLARLVDDIQALDGLYIRIAIPALATAVLAPALVWALWPAGAAPALAAALLLAAAALAVPAFAASRALAAGQSLAEAGAGLRIAALDAVLGRREIRAYAAEGRTLAALQTRESTLLAAQRALARRAAAAAAAALLCAQAAILLVLVAGLPAASTLPALLLALAAFEIVAVMPRAGVQLGLAAAAARRIVAAATAAPAVPDPAAPATPPATHAIRFENVRFAYEGRPPVLDGFSLDIPAGARVAILGPSGAGKSTLAALMLRVVAPASGRVTWGGVDLQTLRPEDVHARIAWVAQATTLFEDTIRANLLLGRPHAAHDPAGDDALWTALDQARLAEFVRALPDGLDTWLGTGGAGLSGGQARRLVLARALLSRAPVLILDEPATGLDAQTERAFLETLNDTAPGRTVILIVHRLTGVERLDRIWRLSAGRAVAAAG